MSPLQQHIDHHFANMLVRKSNITNSEVISAIRQLSTALSNQHSCLRLEDRTLIEDLKLIDCVTAIQTNESQSQTIKTPLVLLELESHALLYTQRYFQYESRIANALTSRNQWLSKDISALAPFLSDSDDPLQQMAAIQAMTRQLVVISGGPGTGKTSTVVKCLAGLLSAEPGLNIKLAAPTGKAAMRLSESIRQAKSRLANVPEQMPDEATTLHRLLGVRGDGNSFRHNRHNPISTDVLILDEASMIDLVMFDRVLDALPPSARLIMLGDPAQLPSVESGSVLADITAQGNCFSEEYKTFLEASCNVSLESVDGQHLLADVHCELRTSFRFDDQAGIGKLAKTLRQGGPLVSEDNPQVQFHQTTDKASIMQPMVTLYAAYLKICRGEATTAELFDAFDQCRLLTPLRDGEMGVTRLNDAFEDENFPDTPGYYHGKPVMIMRNHYALRLFNGDIGICVQRGDKIEVAFRTASGEFEYYAPARLPQHETCYAMTVHKSQGSEFDQVLLLVPTMDRDDFLSRELLYTGVTRTKSQLAIYYQDAEPGQLQSHARYSGLRLRFGTVEADVPATKEPPKPDDSEPQLDLFS